MLSYLLRTVDDERERLALRAYQLDRKIDLVFQCMATHAFEDAVHAHIVEHGEVAIETLGDYWNDAQHDLFGESMTVAPDSGLGWARSLHVVTLPGYTYTYAYGQLLALGLVRRYGAEGAAFVPRYLDVLAAGASRPPAELLSGLGIDPEDPAFWADGVALIAQQLDELEAAAHAAGLLGDAVRGQYT